MENTIEKVGQISCPSCKCREEDESVFISNCGEWICDSCRQRNTIQAYKSSMACGLPKRKMNSRLIERPLRPIEVMLKGNIVALMAGIQGLASFDYTDLVNLHWKQMENNVNAVVDNAIRDINVVRAGILDTIKKSQDRSVNTSLERTALGKVKLQAMSSEVSGFVSVWSERLSRSCPEENDPEIEGALAMSDIYKSTINSFAGNMNMTALEEIKITLGREILGEQDKRSIARTTCPVQKLSCNGSRILHVVFMPDGTLVSFSRDAKITIWDVSSGQALDKIRVRGGYSSERTSIVALPGGMIATCTYKIYILDLKSRKKIWTLFNDEMSRKVMLLLKSGLLASFSSFGTLNIWNPFSGELLMTKKCYNVMLSKLKPFIGYLSNGDFVTSIRETYSQNFEFQVRDASNGKLLRKPRTTERNVSACLVLSNDWIAVGTTTGAIKLIDAMSGGLWPWGIEKAHDGCVIDLIETRSGKLISCAKDSAGLINIRVWRLHDLSLIHTCIEEESDRRISISVSPDEKFVAGVSKNMNFINVWPLE